MKSLKSGRVNHGEELSIQKKFLDVIQRSWGENMPGMFKDSQIMVSCF